MTTFIIRRLLQTVIVLVFVSFFAFMLLHILPGDPALVMLGAEASPEQVEQLRRELGLDRPLLVQYGTWLLNALQGDLGQSLTYGESVLQVIADRLPTTLYIGTVALVLTVLISIPIGVISAVKRGSFLDQLLTTTANLGMAVPVFWLGIMGIYLFSLKLGWLPVQGYTSPFDDFWLSTKQIIMPAIILALVPMASLARQMRSSMLEVIRQDYIRTARSKGLKKRVVIVSHALKNAMIPVITLLGLQVRNLVGGSVLVEQVYNIPGMGRLMVASIFNKDFLVVQGVILIIALVVGLINLLVDLSYGLVDPKIRHE
jgi:peptide/nickel transport system permease protein